MEWDFLYGLISLLYLKIRVDHIYIYMSYGFLCVFMCMDVHEQVHVCVFCVLCVMYVSLSVNCFRFAGPATAVEVHCSTVPRLARGQHADVRTPGEGVEETAVRFAPSPVCTIVLHPDQVDVLHRQQPLVYIAGPPCVGKSLVLLLKGIDWLDQHKPVQVVSSNLGSQAASRMLEAQLKRSRPAADVNLHMYNLDEETDRKVGTPHHSFLLGLTKLLYSVFLKRHSCTLMTHKAQK